MKQFGKLNRAMEAGTISKNEASLKSLMSKGNLKLLVLVTCLFMNFAGQAETIRYVKLNGTGDGSSWANAAGNIQTMLNASASGDQVWIAGGSYLIATTLEMKNGVNVYGGFQGSESNINARPKSDLDANGKVEPWEFTNATILDGQKARRVLNQANAFEAETTWDGITITKGKNETGAGAYIRANGKLNNCIVTNNRAEYMRIGRGGGIYNDGGTVSNCTVYENTAYGYHSGSVVFDVRTEGGGVYNKGTVSNCMVFNNSSNSVNMTGGNAQAAAYGGGIYNVGIINTCCIYNNKADVNGYSKQQCFGGGISNGGTVYYSTILNNQIVKVSASSSSREIDNKIYGINYGVICIDENSDLEQNFIRPTSFVGTAYQDAQITELLRADWRLKQGSQYIEVGSLAELPDWVINGTDLAGNPRVSNGKISLGAYEFDPTASAIKLTPADNGIKIYPNPVSESFGSVAKPCV